MPISRRRRNKRSRKQRAQSGKRALRDSVGLKDPAVKRMFNIGTLNVTTLKLKGEYEFSVRKCGHLCEVLRFMERKGINILGLQAYIFSSSEKSDVLHRKVQYKNTECHLNLITTRDKDEYNGMRFVSSIPLFKVSKISERNMFGEFEMEDGVGTVVNVYSPTRDSSDIEIREFYRELEKCCSKVRENNQRRPITVLGDFSAPLTH